MKTHPRRVGKRPYSAPCWCCPPAPARPSCLRPSPPIRCGRATGCSFWPTGASCWNRRQTSCSAPPASSARWKKLSPPASNSWYPGGGGQLCRPCSAPARLERFPRDYFGTIIIDEAHHAITDGYRRILDYFGSAKVLGVTATPDRGDMRNLGEVFDSLGL